MKTYKSEVRQVQDKVICDVCNQECRDYEFLDLSVLWGYSSGKDNQAWSCDICTHCADKVKGFIESIGGKVHVEEM